MNLSCISLVRGRRDTEAHFSLPQYSVPSLPQREEMKNQTNENRTGTVRKKELTGTVGRARPALGRDGHAVKPG